jgi:hypothetical protein
VPPIRRFRRTVCFPGVDLGQAWFRLNQLSQRPPLRFAPQRRSDLARAISVPVTAGAVWADRCSWVGPGPRTQFYFPALAQAEERRNGRLNGVAGLCAPKSSSQMEKPRVRHFGTSLIRCFQVQSSGQPSKGQIPVFIQCLENCQSGFSRRSPGSGDGKAAKSAGPLTSHWTSATTTCTK